MTRILHALLTLTLLLTIGSAAVYAQKSKAKYTLVIDAGHGGKDPGAIGKKGNREKTINLNVAKAFGKLVAEKYPEVKIIYTRSKDVFIPLKQRANIANKAKADLFISIHTNASKSRSARGCAVLLDDGKITKVGTPEEIVAEFMKDYPTYLVQSDSRQASIWHSEFDILR